MSRAPSENETTIRVQPTTFEQWCEELRAIARTEPLRYGLDPIDACGPECWQDYYDDGYKPIEAWREDGTYD